MKKNQQKCSNRKTKNRETLQCKNKIHKYDYIENNYKVESK